MVRANYNDLQNSVHATTKFLEMFFSNLILGTEYELKNRYMHVDYVDDNSQSVTPKAPKSQFDTLECTLEELAFLELIYKNPSIKQKDLVAETGKSLSTVREQLQDLGVAYIENGWVEFASQTVKHIGRKKELPFVIDGIRHINFLNAIKMICWPAPVYEVVLHANDDTLQQHISIRGAEVFDSTHRAEGDLEGLLAIADIVIDIDGKEKEEVLKELLMKLSDATALSDDNLPLCQIREFIDLFNKDRKWKSYHNAKDLIVSINIEASELLEIFQWTNKKTEPSPEMMERIKEELADVLIYSIDLANAYGIDMTQMIMNKLVKNAEKYPAK